MNTIQQLNSAFKQVRSHFAGPHQKLIDRRSECQNAHRETYERATELSMEADGLKSASGAVSILAQMMASGQLAELQQLAAEQTAAQAGNPFAFLGLHTREGLVEVLGGAQDQEDALTWRVAGAAKVAGTLASDKPIDNAVAQLARDYSLKGPLPQLEGTTEEHISQWAQGLESLADDTARRASLAQQQASQSWDAVSNAQEAMDNHWKTRNSNKGQRIADARAFMVELDQADKATPGILKELRNEAPPEIKPWLNNGLLDSFRAQLKRTEGNLEAVDWNKVLGQLERTSLS